MFPWFQSWDLKRDYMLIQVLSKLYTTRTFKARHTFNDLLFCQFFCAKLIIKAITENRMSCGISKKDLEVDNM